MRARCRLLVIAGLLALGASVPAGVAHADASVGAASYPAGSRGGGAEFGEPTGRVARQPVASVFRVSPRSIVAGKHPKLAVRIVQRGVPSVIARVDFTPLHGGKTVRVDLGQIATGRTVVPRWPAAARLRAGTYVVRVHAKDPAGAVLRRTASASGRAQLTVKAKPKKVRKPAKKPAPKPQPQPQPTPAPTPVPTAGGVFPVQGPHSFGGDDARFGAGRPGHIHEGQDVVAAEGLPVVAPVAGTIVTRANQPSGAGYYLVEDTADGRSLFFAHCQKGSFAVELGQAVIAGQALCRVGQTGSATGPHLHFEIWVGGWRRSKDSRPVDPLAQLQAWDR